MESAIQVRNVSKTFGKVRALDDVSINVVRGEILCLAGADGSGRTTLIKIMSGILQPDEGDVFGVSSDKIGYIPERFALYPDLTVNENIRFFANLHRTPLELMDDMIDPVYKFLKPFGNRLTKNLSGGMKQKLALCCALIHRPEVLFLDEPTTGIDSVSRVELWDMLIILNRNFHMTIIVSTPYPNEQLKSHRVVTMENGRITSIVNPKEVVHNEINIQREKKYSESNIIEVRNLTKKFGNFTAINNISFDVKKGEIFGFLGSNGAGKTTTIRILCGLSSPTEGSGNVGGYDIISEGEKIKTKIGYMSQKFSLFPDLTVKENLLFAAGLYGISRRKAKGEISEYLKEMDCEQIEDRLVADLPLGWRQKAAFLAATFHQPEIVFLDEPTSGVDERARIQIWETISRASKLGITIFVTTHYLNESMFCDRVSIMSDGMIKAIGKPKELIESYQVNDINELFYKIVRE